MVIWYALANSHYNFRCFGDCTATFISEWQPLMRWLYSINTKIICFEVKIHQYDAMLKCTIYMHIDLPCQILLIMKKDSWRTLCEHAATRVGMHGEDARTHAAKI